MPYEATVPVHRRLLWPAVIDPERLLTALPNAVIDAAGNQGVAGRLRVRMRDQTVTFRGIARIIKVIPASLRVTIEVEATFGRSGGVVEGVVEIALRAAGSGTRAVVGGSLHLTDDSSPLPPAEAVDAALGRIVRRWFATLAESSPAAERPEVPEVLEAPPAMPELPRTPERAPLAVVRDVPTQDSAAFGATALANADDTDADSDSDVDSEETSAKPGDEGESTDGGAHESEAASGDLGAGGTTAGDIDDSDTTDSDTTDGDAANGGDSETGESAQPEPVPAVAKAATPQVQLRLVSSREDVSSDADEQPEYGFSAANGNAQWAQTARWDDEADPPGYPSGLDQGTDSGVDTGEDIWSRLRDRGLPRWIPIVGSAVFAALGTAVFFIVTLRRHYQRHHNS